MFTPNKRNVVSLILAMFLAGLFLWAVLNPPSIFNSLPYEIHEAIDPGGVSETVFIKRFDICSAVLVFIICYLMVRNCFKTYKLLE